MICSGVMRQDIGKGAHEDLWGTMLGNTEPEGLQGVPS